MKPRSPSLRSFLPACLLALPLAVLPLAATGEPTELSETPLSGASSKDIKPNILFILDDSLSMEETFLPDWAGTISYRRTPTDKSSQVDFWYPAEYQRLNPNFNGVAYNRKVRYTPPSFFNNAGALDETRYPGQTRAATDGWKKVPVDGYGIQSDGTVNLVGVTDDPASATRAYYYETVPGEFCKDESLRDCRVKIKKEDEEEEEEEDEYTVPATLRWCRTAADAVMAAPTKDGDPSPDCQAVFIDYTGAEDGGVSTYMYPRMPSLLSGRIKLSGTGETSVGNIKVNNRKIMSASVSASDANALAAAIAQRIQDCAYRKTGACEVVGYQAAVDSTGKTVVIRAPDGAGAQPSLDGYSHAGNILVGTPTVFGAGTADFIFSSGDSAGATETKENLVAGYVRFVPITKAVNSYPKEVSRTDCAGSACTYDEEMTNYANWHAYYRTRMQAMKTAASRSFDQIDDRYRIGYLSINNNTEKDFQNVAIFDGAFKGAWYKKLFDATPFRSDGKTADTPLRKALSQAGWLFAGKYNDKTLNGVPAEDPIQYYCQNNAVILSTDGYWNVDAGFDLDGKAVGDQDGPESGEHRPMLDGGVGLRTKRTEWWKKTITPLDKTWRQKKEDTWVVDVTGREVKIEKLHTEETARLKSSKVREKQETWQLYTQTWRGWGYTNYSTPTRWTVAYEYLKKTTSTRQKRESQTYEYANDKTMYQDGKLYKIPKYLYTKSVRKLYQKVTRVTQTNHDLGTTTTIEPGDQCVIKLPNQTCAWDPPTEWTQVSSCTVVAGGEIAASGSGDDRYPKLAAKRECQYRYSADPDQQEVPADQTQVVPTCNAQGSASSPYTIAEQILCLPKTVGTLDRDEVTYCVEDTEYKCEYDWETTKKEWTGPGNCQTTNSGQSPKVGPGRQCFFNQSSTPVETKCEVGDRDVNGVTVTCESKYTGNSVGKTDGWYNSACEESGPDASGKTVECQWTTPSKSSEWLTTCKPEDSATSKVSCEYEYRPGFSYADQTSCPSGSKALVDGSYKAPAYTCTATAWEQKTCENDQCVADLWGWSTEAVQTTVPAACQNPWTSNSNPAADVANSGRMKCYYKKLTDKELAAGTLCTGATTPAAPPFSNPTYFQYFPANNSGLLATYTRCTSLGWTTPTDVAAEKTCSNNGVTEQCSYGSYTITKTYPEGEECTLTEVPQSSGDTAPWTVTHAVRCGKTFKNEGFRESDQCPSVIEGFRVECGAQTTNEQSVTDSLFDPENPSALDSSTRKHRLKEGNWFAKNASGTPINNFVEKATASKPSPSNPEWCEVDDVDSVKVTYQANASGALTQVISCRAVVPNPSDPFAVYSCPGGKDADDNELPSKAGDSQGVDEQGNRLKITCAKTETAAVTENACGKQPDGSFLDFIPGTSPDYVHTYCSPGSGEPTPDTLADVAEYYFKTDLRTSALGNCVSGSSEENVCRNQQMVNTYTLGLGASGVMRFQEDYANYTDYTKPYDADIALAGGDIYSITHGVAANPDKGVCAWQLPDTPCNWPRPKDNSQTNIDDLWHAAINGRGLYFSAKNPESMAAGISAALQNVTAKEGALAAVTTTGPYLEADSAIFQVSFTSGTWTGDLRRSNFIEDADEELSLASDSAWSARSKLDSVPYASRKIYFFAPGELSKLKAFDWNHLGSDQKDYFRLGEGNLTQLCTTQTFCLPNLSAPDFTDDFAQKLVDFLRGDRSNEGELSNLAKYFRKRASVLGDIVGSEATYVQKAPRSYTDNGYSDFRTDTEDRAAMLYVGANDGMLHAFQASDGEEAWAFIPAFILPRLYKLADKAYEHSFFVDGTPVMGDICVSNCAQGQAAPVWKTILVGGANLGGQGYYALDITDPANPKGLWEFTHADLGYSYGNPIITKLANGTWVVLVTSGYNNVSGDGKGHLFVLDAATGRLVSESGGDISTGVGSTETPSGLAKIAAFATYPDYNNTALRVYGGDLLGNLWRFDINGCLGGDYPDIGAAGCDAQLLVTLKDDEGKEQPITSPPELGLVKNRPVVFVATGRMLGASDMSSRDTQSLYAILDRLTDETYANPRELPALFVRQVMDAGEACPVSNPYCATGAPTVTVTDYPVNWAEQNGWYVDFPGEGERVNTSMRLMRGTLAIITNTPQTGACVPAGISYAYFLNYATGSFVSGTEGMAGYQLADALAAAGAYMQDGDDMRGLVQTDGGLVEETVPPFEPPANKVRRISWRELVIE
ncbi:MAG: hypothetical protein LBE85_01410 [Candidatus Accumulibacter sp.]|jgi:hypothetical protein|nr:hypothetical protein [Accumulibacter sp.]